MPQTFTPQNFPGQSNFFELYIYQTSFQMDEIDVEWTVPGLLWTVEQRNDGKAEIKINSKLVSPQMNFPPRLGWFLPLLFSAGYISSYPHSSSPPDASSYLAMWHYV